MDRREAPDRRGSCKKGATQASSCKKAESRLPNQHQRKPGSESELEPAPQFMALDYRGSGKLADRVVLVTGAVLPIMAGPHP